MKTLLTNTKSFFEKNKKFALDDSFMVIYLILAYFFKWAPVSTIIESTILFLSAVFIFWGFIVNSNWAIQKKQKTHIAFQIIAAIPLIIEMFK